MLSGRENQVFPFHVSLSFRGVAKFGVHETCNFATRLTVFETPSVLPLSREEMETLYFYAVD